MNKEEQQIIDNIADSQPEIQAERSYEDEVAKRRSHAQDLHEEEYRKHVKAKKS